MDRAAIYLRLSKRTDRNAPNLDTQRQWGEDLAGARGWRVVAVLSDYGEGAFDRDDPLDRPGYAELLELMEAGAVDVVVAWHPDRLWRDDLERALFMRSARTTNLAAVVTSAGEWLPDKPEDDLTSTIVTAVSRYESASKRRRLRAKHRQIALAGKSNGGGHRPFGYEDDRLTVRPLEAAAVEEACRRLLEGEALRRICADLTGRGILTTTGGAWSASSLRRLLTSARIAGLRSHRGELVGPAVWPALVDRETWTRVRAILLAADRRGAAHPRSYLLTGIAVCGHPGCGAKLVARPRDDKRRCYVCARGPGFSGCGHLRVLAEPFEAEVVERMWAWLASDELAAAGEEEVDVTPLYAEVEACEGQLGELGTAWGEGAITKAEWLGARAALERRLTTAQAALDERLRRRRGLRVVDDPESLRASWDDLGFDQRRAVVVDVVERVVLGPAVRGRNFFDPGRVAVEWRS